MKTPFTKNKQVSDKDEIMNSLSPSANKSAKVSRKKNTSKSPAGKFAASDTYGDSADEELSRRKKELRKEERKKRASISSKRGGMSKAVSSARSNGVYGTVQNTTEDGGYSSEDGGPADSDYDSDRDTSAFSSKRCMSLLKSARRKRKGGKGSHAIDDLAMSPLAAEIEELFVPISISSEQAGVKYSLRSAVGDGSQKQSDARSVMDRRELKPNGSHLHVGHWAEEGLRAYMEDRYAIESLGALATISTENGGRTKALVSNELLRDHHTNIQERSKQLLEQQQFMRKSMPMSWYAVFDGHGGEKASQYCVDWLSSYVRCQKMFPVNIVRSMQDAFTTIDSDFVRTGYNDGTTACAAVVVGGKKIVCANAGDSRAIILGRNGIVTKITRDHKPGVPDETKRITDLGGRVIYWGRWRVESILAVSRAIGDASLKPYITAEPEVVEHLIKPDDWFLVLASDGIWDVLENEQVAEYVISHACVEIDNKLVCDPDKLKSAARKLCRKAGKLGSSDNLSAVVVDLRSYPSYN